MGAKKLHNLFTGKSKKMNTTALKEVNHEKSDKEQNIKDKAEIESYKKAIEEKLKDPEMAKKAAQIIADLINKSTK